MIVSNIYLNFLDALDYPGKPSRRPIDALERGIGATYRLYETARVGKGTVLPPFANQNPHWMFLAVDKDDEFARLCRAVGCEDIAADARFGSEQSRWDNRAALAGLLEPLFLTRTAQEWEDSLLAAGLGCIVADAMSNFAFLYEDSQAKALGLTTEIEHPSIGRYYRHTPLLQFSQTPGVATCMSTLGEYTQQILGELGYDANAMEVLRAAGVVSWPEEAEVLASAYNLN
jgi:crotonobetainyl-CoA:carnitine CoA-transferase CaiB-like acyl-CoA transferase